MTALRYRLSRFRVPAGGASPIRGTYVRPGRYAPRHPKMRHWGDHMRRRLAILAAALAAAGIGAAAWWIVQPSYDDMVKDCQKALTTEATKTHRPGACKGLKQDDYDTILMAWSLKHALKEMPQEDQDLLDYYDDGSINGSLTDGK